MVNKWHAILLLLTVTLPAQAQDRKNLQGRIIASGNPARDIFVINKNTGIEVKSAADGSFTLPVKTGDRLTAYSSSTKVREFAVTAYTLTQNPYILEVDPAGTELQEVVVTGITSESLGLVPKNQEQFTPAEQKLATAGSPRMNPMGLDPVINAISGRTKMLKKALEAEHKELLAQKINNLFTDNELAGFGLPKETARGFIFYIVEDTRLTDAVKANNNEMVRLLLMELAEKYAKLQAE